MKGDLLVQRIPLTHLCPGMVTAKRIFSADGRVLIGEDVELTKRYIEGLAHFNILSVYIRNPYFEDAIPPEIISENSRVKLIQAVQQQFLAIRENKRWNPAQFITLAEQIVDEVGVSAEAMVQLTDIRSHNEFTFGHSVNVAVLCVLIGFALQYPRTKLIELALGGLLHDVGKMKITTKILNKPARLTDDEYKIMQTHAELGFEILRTTASHIISRKSMLMAFQHQEKPDGTGYPRQLTGSAIPEYSKIVAVADVYDAVTSDRPYHRGLFPHEAAMLLADGMGKQFDVEVLTAFLTRVAIYSIGSVVELSSGQIGVVTQVSSGMQNRPTIRLMLDKNRNPFTRKIVVDLHDYPAVEIKQVLGESAVGELNRMTM
jgi:HD-GYP domain-containing protein (c-di-GMP phosphodiesterase class II)